MSKRLPYFQFEPAEWLAGDIMFCSLSARGLFTDIIALYWQKECELTIDQVKRRFNCESELEELISEKIIKIENNNIIIEFLDNQLVKAIGKSKVNSENGSKGGRPKRIKEPNKNPNESEKKPNAFNSVIENESEKKPIREDKIREDNIREDKIKANKVFTSPTQIEVENYFIENGYTKESGLKAFNYYSSSNWKDSKGNQVKNWKQKMIGVWFKEENKISLPNKMTFEEIKAEQRKNMAF